MNVENVDHVVLRKLTGAGNICRQDVVCLDVCSLDNCLEFCEFYDKFYGITQCDIHFEASVCCLEHLKLKFFFRKFKIFAVSGVVVVFIL